MATTPPPATPFSVVGAITAYSIIAQVAKMFATEIFMKDFQTYTGILNKDINDDLKTFSTIDCDGELGQIIFLPDRKQKFKSSNEWCKDLFRLVIIPTTIGFPIFTIDYLLRSVKMHKSFTDRYGTVPPSDKPKNIWAPLLFKYLLSIPG